MCSIKRLWKVFNHKDRILFVIDSLTRRLLTKTETRTTMTLFIVCFCYFLCVMPRLLCKFLELLGFIGAMWNPYVKLVVYCVYWTHYALNFFIYAACSKQFRQAYLHFLKEVSGQVDLL